MLLVPMPIIAQAFEQGDVFVAARTNFSFPNFDFRSHLLWYDRDGNLKGELMRLENAAIGGLAVSPAGTLYAITGGSIVSVTPQGGVTPEYTVFPGARATSFAADGSLYVGFNDVDVIRKYDTSHNLIRTFVVGPVGRGIHSLDLARDQCALYFLDTFTLRAFDVCRKVPLPDVVTTFPGDGIVFGLRILPDGTFLIGHRDGVLQYTAQGQLIRQMPTIGLRLALDTDARSVWASAGDVFSKIDVATGLPTTGPIATGLVAIESIAVYGEPRAAIASGADVPTLSTWALVAIAAMLILLGVARMRM